MKKQLFVVLLLLTAGVACGASSDAQYVKNALQSIDEILAEKGNFQDAYGRSPELIIENLNAAKLAYLNAARSGNRIEDIRKASPYLMAAKDLGLSVTVDIPGKSKYRLSQMITAIFFDGDPFAPTI